MSNKIVIKKCEKCGAMVEVIVPCTCENCGISCCGEQMKTIEPNNKEFSFEKHLPTFKINEDKTKIEVKVNHVMEEQHFIEWVAIKNKNGKQVKFLTSGQEASAVFDYEQGSIVYAYCNLHGLWYVEV